MLLWPNSLLGIWQVCIRAWELVVRIGRYFIYRDGTLGVNLRKILNCWCTVQDGLLSIVTLIETIKST